MSIFGQQRQLTPPGANPLVMGKPLGLPPLPQAQQAMVGQQIPQMQVPKPPFSVSQPVPQMQAAIAPMPRQQGGPSMQQAPSPRTGALMSPLSGRNAAMVVKALNSGAAKVPSRSPEKDAQNG